MYQTGPVKKNEMHNYFRMDGVLAYILVPDRHGCAPRGWSWHVRSCPTSPHPHVTLCHGTGQDRARQAIPILPLDSALACALTLSLVGSPPLSLTHSLPFRSKEKHDTPKQISKEKRPKRKPVTQESFPTHLPPPQICAKICFLWMP